MAGRGGQPLQHKDNLFQWAEKSVKSGRRPWDQTKKPQNIEVEVQIGNVSIFLCVSSESNVLFVSHYQKSKAQLELKLAREDNMTGFCK